MPVQRGAKGGDGIIHGVWRQVSAHDAIVVIDGRAAHSPLDGEVFPLLALAGAAEGEEKGLGVFFDRLCFLSHSATRPSASPLKVDFSFQPGLMKFCDSIW
jgi:hypothetical protein